MNRNDDRIDLSGDAVLPVILDEREQLSERIAASQKRLKEINLQIKERLQGAHYGVLPGWKITNVVFQRREFVMPSQEVSWIRAKRTDES